MESNIIVVGYKKLMICSPLVKKLITNKYGSILYYKPKLLSKELKI